MKKQTDRRHPRELIYGSTLTMLILCAFCMQMRSFDIVPIMQIVANFTERYLKYPSFYLNRLFFAVRKLHLFP